MPIRDSTGPLCTKSGPYSNDTSEFATTNNPNPIGTPSSNNQLKLLRIKRGKGSGEVTYMRASTGKTAVTNTFGINISVANSWLAALIPADGFFVDQKGDDDDIHLTIGGEEYTRHEVGESVAKQEPHFGKVQAEA